MLSRHAIRALWVIDVVILAVYVPIIFFTREQLRAEMSAVAFLSFGIPTVGAICNEWVQAKLSFWARENVALRGMITVGVWLLLGIAAWLLSQEIVRFTHGNPSSNYFGRIVQPFYYCGVAIGAANLFVAFTSKRGEANWRALLVGSGLAAAALFALLTAIVLVHAAS